MAAFRFRAQAALDLRRRQHEAAEAAHAAARRVLEDAELRWKAAERAKSEAERAAREAEAAAFDTTVRTWHRSWIERLRQDAARQFETVARCREAEREAHRVAIEARRKLKALERYRDRVRRAHRQGERRAEQKALDELATSRHLMTTYYARERQGETT